MKLAFKRAHGLGRLIDWLSGARGYCHVELRFSDGPSFSSTTYGPGDDGCRFKAITYSHPEQWAFASVVVTPDIEAKMRAKATEIEGSPYDYRGVARFVLKIMPEHPKAYFCSEAVVTVLQAGGLFTELTPHTVSPNRLAKLVGV